MLMSSKRRGFIEFFLRTYPGRTASLVGLLTLSGLAEGIGVVSILPLLELATTGGTGPRSGLSQHVVHLLGGVGLKPDLAVLLSIIVGGILLKGTFRLLAMKQVGFTVARVAMDLRLSLIRALLRTRWSYFVNQSTGRLTTAMGHEASRAAQSYRYLCALLASIIQAAIYAVVAFLVSWQVALFAIFGGVLVVSVLWRLVKVSWAAGHSQTVLMRSVIGRLTDAIQGIKPIKAMAREQHLQPLLEAEAHGINRAQEREVLASEAVNSAQEPILVLLMAIALYVVLTLGHQPFTSVLMTAFLFYRLAGRISLIQSDYQSIVVGEAAFSALRGDIEAAEAAQEPHTGEAAAPTLSDGIAFESVDFAYGDNPVLRDLSFYVPAGRFVVLAGASGAGKTTIVDLIAALYSPQAGRILIDDTPLDELDLVSWRRSVGYVPQEMFLFHDTLLQNVTLGDPRVDRAAAVEALKLAGAWEFVAQLPDGLDTVLGERGGRLSGGQRQRVALARALADHPKLLILDETTTSLDPATEQEILAALRQLRGRVTILAVSHQRAVMEAADLVLYIENGSVSARPGVSSPERRVAVAGDH